jgi:hypothetical protein
MNARQNLKTGGLSRAEAAEGLASSQPESRTGQTADPTASGLDTLINLADPAGLPVSLRIGDDEVVA